MRFSGVTIILFFLILGPVATAQMTYSSTDKKALKLYEESASLLRERDFDGAVESLQKALLRDPSFLECHLRLASAYKVMLKNDLAEQHYRQALAVDSLSRLNIETYFALGQITFDRGDHNEAKRFLSRYIQLNPSNTRRASLAYDLVAKIEFALKLMADPLPFDPQPLPSPLNGFTMQYFPSLTADGNQLFFTARKGNAPTDDENIYISRRDSVGNWSVPDPVSEQVNSRRNEGTSSISADGKTLIFTSCNAPDSFGSCDLYVVKREGEVWGRPQNMGRPINTPGWESQPSLSADGRTLYFVTDRRGGQGKRDIWVSSLSARDNWMEPVNLGPIINTAADDISPFIHVNGQSLYFSSEGHPGVGRLDLFLSEKNGIEWSTPKNLGYPINTTDDQVSLVITSDGLTAYYSHEQVTYPANEALSVIGGPVPEYHSALYSFAVPEEIRVQNKSTFLTGRVLDAETNQPLAAEIEMFDINDATLAYKITSDKVDGRYFVVLTEGREYSIYVNRKGYLFENITFNFIEKQSREPEVLDIYLKPIRSGATSVLKNIFFDVDQYVLMEKSKTELNEIIRFLKENPEIRLQIEGHSDNTGSRSYNLMLSENRAKSVYDFLVSGGMPKERLQYKGYGDSNPKAPNDSEVNRQLNRRIEFRIL